jgi:RNA:NAD 2'-phosphotransferase (TPT1/KptA family)
MDDMVAAEYGIKIRSDGYVVVGDMLASGDFKKKNIGIADINRVVTNNDKQRFELKTEGTTLLVRAAQGKSLLLLKQSNHIDSNCLHLYDM